jgi:hypothetical protein
MGDEARTPRTGVAEGDRPAAALSRPSAAARAYDLLGGKPTPQKTEAVPTFDQLFPDRVEPAAEGEAPAEVPADGTPVEETTSAETSEHPAGEAEAGSEEPTPEPALVEQSAGEGAPADEENQP